MAGYSKTPLSKKLGLSEDTPVYVVRPPENYLDLVESWPDQYDVNVRDVPDLPAGLRFVHVFAAMEEVLERELPTIKSALAKDATLWISWPKKAARKLGVETDLDGGAVRRLGLEAGLVDLKVCSVDEIWSGHKFVYRLADR